MSTKPPPVGMGLPDFYAFLPKHKYIYAPTGDLWPIKSINSVLPPVPLTKKDGTPVLDENGEPKILKPSHMARQPPGGAGDDMGAGRAEMIVDRLAPKAAGSNATGWTFNLYQPPRPCSRASRQGGALARSGRQDLSREGTEHIIGYCAHRIQKPAEKINHAIVLAGAPGIGKDTILEPLRLGVGAGNFTEASPTTSSSKWNDYMRSVVLRISEVKDLGEVDRYTLYETTKTMLAAPPDMLRINIKYVPQHYMVNVTGVIITTNYRPRRALSAAGRPAALRARHRGHQGRFRGGFLAEFWHWYRNGGLETWSRYLAGYDISKLRSEKAAGEDRRRSGGWSTAGWRRRCPSCVTRLINLGQWARTASLSSIRLAIGCRRTR